MTPEHKAVAELAFNTKYLGCEPFAECPPHVQRLWLDAWEAATFHAAAICRDETTKRTTAPDEEHRKQE